MITDLRKLRHVIGVADAESFTLAAGSMAITQSALTKSVAEVEHRLNIKLFQRLPRGVRLTEAGEMFVERARQILADTEDLMSGIDKLRDLRGGRLRLGVAPAAFASLIDQAVTGFVKIYPGIRIEVLETDVEDTARLLAAGRLDVVVGEANYLAQWNEIETEVMAHLHNCFIARPDHPVRALAEIRARDLLAYPLVVPSDRLPTDEALTSVYAKAGLSPVEPQYRCNNLSLLRKLVLNTDAFAPLVSYAPPGRAMRKAFLVVEGVVPLRQHVLGLASAKGREPAPAVAAFRDIFKNFRADAALA